MDYTLVDQLPSTFQTLTAAWQPAFVSIGLNLLYALILLELTWAAFSLALRRAPMEEWMTQLVSQIMFAGFFVWLLVNSQWLATSVVDSFREAGSTATGLGTQIFPSDLLGIGANISSKLWNAGVSWDVGRTVAIAMVAIVILLAFAWMAAMMVLALIEMYLVVAAAPLFLGFGGSRWSLAIALSMTRYVISVGAKLLVLMMLAGILRAIAMDWSAAFDAGDTRSTDVMAGAALCMAVLTYSIPNLIASMINGSSLTGGAALTAAASAFTGAAAGAGMAMAGGAKALDSSFRLASAQREASGESGGSKVGSAARLILDASHNFQKSVTDAAGDKLSGRMSPRASTLWGAAANMRDETRHIRAESSRPKPSPEDISNNELG